MQNGRAKQRKVLGFSGGVAPQAVRFTLNPKSEGRRPKEIRGPKAEFTALTAVSGQIDIRSNDILASDTTIATWLSGKTYGSINTGSNGYANQVEYSIDYSGEMFFNGSSVSSSGSPAQMA